MGESSQDMSFSFKQGKAVSNKNIIIAANRILEEHAMSIRDWGNANGKHLKKSYIETRPKRAPSLRLDRLDRSVEVQNACECFDMENPQSFKRDCNFVDISPATFSYLIYTLSRKEPLINLRNLGIGPTGALVVMRKLAKDKPAVTELDMSSNNLGDSGTATICKFLAANDTVLKVDFSRNCIQRVGANAIASMLAENRKLKTLVLSHNALSEEHLELIAIALQAEKSLENLDLGSNSFTSRCGHLFSCLLAKNSSLVTLNLSCNLIGDEGIHDLIPGLKQNGTIRTLDLSWNNIGDEGAAWIADVLMSNGVLRHLDIGYNRVGTEGIKALSESLSSNSSLEFLKLSGNNLHSRDAVVLMEAILNNSSQKLARLYLGEIPVCPEFSKLLNEIRSTHKKFQVFGMVNASGQEIKLRPQKNPLEALDSYIVNNNLCRPFLFFD